MNSSDNVQQIRPTMPCVRGCVQTAATDDQPALIMGALHGNYCDRCYWRTNHALKLAGPAVEHIISLVAALSAPQKDGSQRVSKNAPLPFNVAAFNDANEVYSRLVYWSALFATRLNRPVPVPAARAWRTNNNRVVGLPADITPQAARYAVAVMANWLSIHLADICATLPSDDVDYFHDDIKDLYRTNAKWPREEQPEYGAVGCPDDNCRGRIIIYPPQELNDERRILCEKCGRHILPGEYGLMERVVKQVQAERALEAATDKRHKRAAAHLVKKYGGLSA